MKPITIFTFVLFVLGALTGCGGGSSTGSSSSNSQFAGSYTGTGSDTKLGNLTIALTVSSRGILTGTATSGGLTYDISGGIDFLGEAKVALVVAGPVAGAASVSDSGTLTLNPTTGALTGTLTGTFSQALPPPNGTGPDTLTINVVK
jgi:hypothetical protein